MVVMVRQMVMVMADPQRRHRRMSFPTPGEGGSVSLYRLKNQFYRILIDCKAAAMHCSVARQRNTFNEDVFSKCCSYLSKQSHC